MTERVLPWPRKRPGPGVICAWCKAVLVHGSLLPSHGLCERCLEERFQDDEKIIPFPGSQAEAERPRAQRGGEMLRRRQRDARWLRAASFARWRRYQRAS